MEKDVAIGNVGKLEFIFAAGKVSVGAQFALSVGLNGNVTLSDDLGGLIDALQTAVEKALPATAAYDPAVFGFIKQTLMAAG